MRGLLGLSLLLSCLLCCGLCAYNQVHLQNEWLSWKRLHAKEYYNIREEGSRWAVWRRNYQLIEEHNRNNHTFKLGLNEFADLVNPSHSPQSGENNFFLIFFQTQEEFAYYYLNTPRAASDFPRSGVVHDPSMVAETEEGAEDGDKAGDKSGGDGAPTDSNGVDWRQRGAVTSVSIASHIICLGSIIHAFTFSWYCVTSLNSEKSHRYLLEKTA